MSNKNSAETSASAATDSAAAFANAFGGGLDMMRRFWGAGLPAAEGLIPRAGFAQAIPSMLTPTMDIGELDKRIADLRAVEQWLNLNTNMLRTTIQSLEVQRNTLATLKSFGGAFSDAISRSAQPGGAARPAAEPFKAPEPEPKPAAKPRRKQKPAASKTDTAATASAATPLQPDPAQWWNALQQQFTQIANAAAASTARPAAKSTRRKPG